MQAAVACPKPSEDQRTPSAPPVPPSKAESDRLRSLPLFDRLGDDLVRKLIDASSIRQYRPGAFIVRQGEPLEGLQVIVRGIVDLMHVDGERECGVLLFSARDLLMPSAVLFGEPALVTARALTATKLMVIDSISLRSALGESLSLSMNLMKATSGQWRMAVRNILDLNCRTAAQRLGAFLLRLVDLQPDLPTPLLPISKRHLAVRLGMTAETLSRVLQVVAKHGLYLRGRSIIVRDRAAIEEFCGPDPYPEHDERSLQVFAL